MKHPQTELQLIEMFFLKIVIVAEIIIYTYEYYAQMMH